MQAQAHHEQQVVGDLARGASHCHLDGLLPCLGQRWVLLQRLRAPISTHAQRPSIAACEKPKGARHPTHVGSVIGKLKHAIALQLLMLIVLGCRGWGGCRCCSSLCPDKHHPSAACCAHCARRTWPCIKDKAISLVYSCN